MRVQMHAHATSVRLEIKVCFENNANAWEINRFFIIKQIKKPRLCSVLL